MNKFVVVVLFIAAACGCWYTASHRYKNLMRRLVSQRHLVPSVLGLVAYTLSILMLVMFVTSASQVQPIPAIPENLMRLFDDVMQTGVLLDGEAVELNEWLNRYARSRPRNLEVVAETVGGELPMEVVKKVAYETENLDADDRLKLFRALAFSSCSEADWHIGEFGETRGPGDSIELTGQIFRLLRSAADGVRLTDRERRILRDFVDSNQFLRHYLTPTAPIRDDAPPVINEPLG